MFRSNTRCVRYLEGPAVVGASLPTTEVPDPVGRPITRKGRRYRALRPIAAEEAKLFSAVINGSHHVPGFRNRDIRPVLDPNAERDPDRSRHSLRFSAVFAALRGKFPVSSFP